jgi:hypothetical protein
MRAVCGGTLFPLHAETEHGARRVSIRTRRTAWALAVVRSEGEPGTNGASRRSREDGHKAAGSSRKRARLDESRGDERGVKLGLRNLLRLLD